jgi:hypothetical protein
MWFDDITTEDGSVYQAVDGEIEWSISDLLAGQTVALKITVLIQENDGEIVEVFNINNKNYITEVKK